VRPYYEQDGITIFHGDCRESLPGLRAPDLLLTDPPYGIPPGSSFWRENGTTIADYGEEGFNAGVDGWRALVSATEGAYWAEWCRGAETAMGIYAALSPIGWARWREFVLCKTAPAPTPRPTFMSGFEICAIAHFGRRRWFGGQHPDRWIGLTPNRLGTAQHPTQKPLGAILGLLVPLSEPGGLVLDPFMGSGTTLVAAKQMGRRAIGIEIEERYCEVAAKRLSQGVLDFGGVA
jgi:site-specific DNA-methyltransferase (adenine-specific)